MKGSKREKKQNNNQKVVFYIFVLGSIFLLATVLSCGIYFYVQIQKRNYSDATKYQEFSKHYVFLTDESDQEFWDKVYENAAQEAEDNGIYLERLGQNLSMDYEIDDLLRMAINASVDGIIVSCDDNRENIKLINKAVENGIVVATIRQDVGDSNRQCFIGVNQYDLGITYGKEIINMIEKSEKIPQKIEILVEQTETDARQTILSYAIRDEIAQAINMEEIPEISVRTIDTMDTFSAEEGIRNVFLKQKELPDIIVCTNSMFTQCCYQSVVDFNEVGNVKIIGFYETKAILEAIEKNIITTTISLDAKEMGEQCIRAMTEYEENGYTNTYIPVQIEVIDSNKAGEMLYEMQQANEIVE